MTTSTPHAFKLGDLVYVREHRHDGSIVGSRFPRTLGVINGINEVEHGQFEYDVVSADSSTIESGYWRENGLHPDDLDGPYVQITCHAREVNRVRDLESLAYDLRLRLIAIGHDAQCQRISATTSSTTGVAARVYQMVDAIDAAIPYVGEWHRPEMSPAWQSVDSYASSRRNRP